MIPERSVIFEAGDTVRTSGDLLASDGSIIPIGSSGMIVGYQDDRPIVDFEDHDTGEHITATTDVWSLYRVTHG